MKRNMKPTKLSTESFSKWFMKPKIYFQKQLLSRHTLHNSIGGFYWRKISDNSDVIISVRALNVNVDGFFDLSMQTCNHSRWVRHIG